MQHLPGHPAVLAVQRRGDAGEKAVHQLQGLGQVPGVQMTHDNKPPARVKTCRACKGTGWLVNPKNRLLKIGCKNCGTKGFILYKP